MTKSYPNLFLRYAAILFVASILAVGGFDSLRVANAGDAPPTSTLEQQSGSMTPRAGSVADKAGTQTSKTYFFSQGQIWLAAAVLLLLAALFVLLIWYSHRLEATGYLGKLFRESVVDLEYKRLIGNLTEKWDKGEYYRIAELELIADRPKPDPEIEYMVGRTRLPGMSGIGGLGGSRRPSYSLESSQHIPPQRHLDEDNSPERRELERRKEKLYDEYQRAINRWQEEVDSLASQKFEQDKQAQLQVARERSESAAGDAELSVLRSGRGPEFVLEFTAVVVIVFAATALGILGILDTQQLGTLLAAIAGYVLGRATSKVPSTAPEESRVRSGKDD